MECVQGHSELLSRIATCATYCQTFCPKPAPPFGRVRQRPGSDRPFRPSGAPALSGHRVRLYVVASSHRQDQTPDLRDRLQSTLGNAYVLDRELGGGGMSRVFVADETAFGRSVVVKVLRPDLAEGISSDRFRREILLAAQLQQANIVPVLAAGTTDGLPYYTMPFVEGESLRARLARDSALPVSDVVGILKDVAKALQYAHQRGIVHRDIKPDNVLLSGGTAVVTDFGIAKALSAARTEAQSSTLTGIGTSIGTPIYMAPEQAAGDPATDHRADLYALGAMAFELIAGRPPFIATSPHKLLAAHMTEQPPSITDFRPDCPSALAAVVAKLLEKDPAARPQSAGEVLRDLDGVATTSSGAGHDALPGISIATRRQLGRALAIYAAAFVLVAILARTAITLIGLPDWVFPAALMVMALGLPMILLTAFVHHGSRVARTMATTTPGGSMQTSSTMHRIAVKASPHVTWRRTTIGGAMAVGLLILLVASYMVLRTMGIGPAGSLFAAGKLDAKERLLVVEFKAPPSDSSLGIVVSEAVRTNLAQSRAVSILPASFVSGALQRMQRPNAKLDLALAREMAQREGVKAVVDGAITPVGQGFIVTTRLVSAETGDEMVSARETAKDATDLIPAIDRLTRSLRGKIGESLREVRATPSLAQVSTSSFAALRKYSEGYRANYAEGDYRKAIAAFEEAIQLDSTFAMAYRMGSIAYNNAALRPGRADTLREKAFMLRNRLSERERAAVEAAWYAAGTSGADRAKAIAASSRVVELDPTDASTLMNLGRLYATRREYSVAESLYRRALATDSNNALIYVNLVPALVSAGKVEAADTMSAMFRKRFPRHRNVPYNAWLIWAAREQFDSVEAICARARASADSAIKVDGHGCAASLAEWRGRLRESAAHRVEMRRVSAARTGTPTRETTVLLDSAERSIWYREDTAAGLKAVDEAALKMRSMPPRDRPYLNVARYYALAGKPDKARAVLVQYEAELDTARRRTQISGLHRAQGRIALAEGRYADAIRDLRASEIEYDGAPTGCVTCVLPELANAYDLAGNADSAITIYERYLSAKYSTRLPNTDASYQAGTFKRLGELYDARGDREKAAHYYAKFIDLWKNADPDLQPKVQQVKLRLARLRDTEQLPR